MRKLTILITSITILTIVFMMGSCVKSRDEKCMGYANGEYWMDIDEHTEECGEYWMKNNDGSLIYDSEGNPIPNN